MWSGAPTEKWRPLHPFLHLNLVRPRTILNSGYFLRTSSDPLPPPVREPVDPPENPDTPVREPEPAVPGQI